MRLSVEQALQDDNRFANCNALAELKYCGWEIHQRRAITNDEIRFYAWLCRSAVALLKEQEPRVLSREEMKKMIGESVFVEEPPNNADPRCGWAEVTEGIEPPEEGFNFPGGVDFNAESGWDTYDGDLYGLDKGCGWRAWNRRPTPEQMKAVKWE